MDGIDVEKMFRLTRLLKMLLLKETVDAEKAKEKRRLESRIKV